MTAGCCSRSRPRAADGRRSRHDGRVLVGDDATKTATLIDPTIRGELGTVRFCGTFVAAESLVKARDVIAVDSFDCGPDDVGVTTLISAATLTPFATLEHASGQVLGVSPDGALVVRQTETARPSCGPWGSGMPRPARMSGIFDGLCPW